MQPLPIRAFRRKILSHYQRHGRNLPWRETADPYAILLSEIMLQQTQVDRVISYYGRWLMRWPSIHELAKAPLSEVLKEWMGLGYNNRAKHIHQTAKIISERYNGEVMEALSNYRELPGIGPYTAAAVKIFAGNKDIVTVDTNIRRILIHEFRLNEDIPDKELWKLAALCLPKGKSREWHNALMDYGATLLTSRKTGIRPKTIQSKFEGSDRQIRARIIRQIIGNKASFASLSLLAGGDKERLQRILEKMSKEKLLKKEGKSYALLES